MKHQALKKWEVKTGKNRGLYIAVTPEQSKAFFPEWGILVYEYNSGIYNFHGVKHTDFVLTCSTWARHSMKKHWEKVTTKI